MGSRGALVCTAAFVLFVMSSASEDADTPPAGEWMLQRQINPDFEEIMKEMQQPDQSLMQTEMDLSELLDPEEFPIEQVMVSPPVRFRPEDLKPRGRPLGLSPRSFWVPPDLQYPVQFPLGRPTSDNLQAICLHGDRRPSYPDSYFPYSGYGKLKRKAKAVNKAESWFRSCCGRNLTGETDVTLCCATQAWELSIQSFCEEDTSVKDIQEPCCALSGSHMFDCFHKVAPNPNYEPSEEPQTTPLPKADFQFDPSTCQRTVMTPYSGRGIRKKKMKTPSPSQKVEINFPPGRPNQEVLEPLCKHQKLRPLYAIKCLPGSGHELVARQAKTVNRIEKGFRKCCKKPKQALQCVDRKWTDELDKFCSGLKGEPLDFHCCSKAGEERFGCFQSISPDPHFNLTSVTEEISLNNICDTFKIIKKKFPVGFPLKSFMLQCCPLPEQDKSSCFDQKLREVCLTSLSSSKRPSPPAVRRCCRKPSSQEAKECVSDILMEAVTKATNFLRQKKKKVCPLS